MTETKPEHKTATKQPKRVSPISGVAPPDGFEKYPERRHNGAWKKEDTARYKLEQMLKLNQDEIVAIANDKNAPLFERRIARSLLKENEWKITESMVNQVYGMPKQQIEQTNLEPPKPLSPRKQKKDK